MAFSLTHEIGVDVTNPVLGSVLAANGMINGSNVIPPHRIGTQVWGSDGKRYVFASVAVGTNLASANAACTVNAGTFAATASGGSYLSPTFTSPASLGTTGNTYPDYAWFAAASV